MNAMTEIPAPLVFTDSAADKVKQLIQEEGNTDLKLRVFVTGGGCSGFQYGFTFDEVKNEDDTVMEKNGVMLLIDPMSYQYLVGAEIDYSEGLVLFRLRTRTHGETGARSGPFSFQAG
jgi:iron-sulfur cluster insertion protein